MMLWNRTFWFAIFVLVLASNASSQQTLQSVQPQNGGTTVFQHHLSTSTNEQKQLASNQSQYEWLELDPVGTGAGYCYADAHALNDSDQVVVNWSDPNDCNILHASLWDKGKWKLLDYAVNPNCAEPGTYLTSITNWGFAFGSYGSDCHYAPAGGVNVSNLHWYFLPDRAGRPYNQGFDMSDNGLAVGVFSNLGRTNFQHWVWDGHQYIYPSFPKNWDVNTNWAGPLFVNIWGQIAGEYFDKDLGYERGYLQEGSKITVLDVPGDPDGGTFANAINNDGYVVLCGLYDAGSPYYPSASFVYRQGKFTQLPTPPFDGMTLWFIFNVNDRGDMIGRYWDSESNIHTFIAIRR